MQIRHEQEIGGPGILSFPKKDYEQIFREKHNHGNIRILEKNGYKYLSCSLCCGEIRIKQE